jgi:hypothetical protein
MKNALMSDRAVGNVGYDMTASQILASFLLTALSFLEFNQFFQHIALFKALEQEV